ncbi:MAG: AmmeMemoRadiSam system protein A [Bacillota bacterium]
MIVYGALAPHPPLIIPEIGGRELQQVTKTVKGMNSLATEIADKTPDALVIITPHGNVFRDAVSILGNPRLKGNLARFGKRQLKYEHPNCPEFLEALQYKAGVHNIPVAAITSAQDKHGLDPDLDHGVIVPLHYLEQAGLKDIPLLAISYGMISLEELYRFGMLIREVSDDLGLKVVVLASGDMSHRLKSEGPYSYHPDGPVFDQQVKDLISQGKTMELLRIPAALRENAGECGYRSLVILMGSLDGYEYKPQIFSYEGPFGVGYLVAGLTPGENQAASLYLQLVQQKRQEQKERRERESVLVQWARKCLEAFVESGKRLPLPHPLPEEMNYAAAAFVSLKKDGQLRGCIGTLEPVRANLALEIRENAISAGTQDYRFSPVQKEELPDLVYSVDVLSRPEPINSISQLDPKKYGVIVRQGSRSGVLLPDLEGIDTPEEQVEIAMQKAGIRRGTKVDLERFEVRRFY